MTTSALSAVLFSTFALGSQLILVAFFAAHRLKLEFARAHESWVHALGIPGLALSAYLLVQGEEWGLWLPGLVFSAWAAFGYTVDAILEIPWRHPIDYPLFTAYVSLSTAGQLLFWVPLWFISPLLWLIYGGLFVLNTTLVVRGHLGPQDPLVVRR